MELEGAGDEAGEPGVCGLPHKATAQRNLVPAEPATQSSGAICWLYGEDGYRPPADGASDNGSESAEESLDTDEANDALRLDNARLEQQIHILTKHNAHLLAHIGALEQDAATRVNMAASSQGQVQELERQLADVQAAHAAAMDKNVAEIKALKGLLGNP